MFGFVTANPKDLTKEQTQRYSAVYCGICRGIRENASNICRLTLQYDMAFLALVLMSLYEPEETGGKRACRLHPIRPHPWTDNGIIRYAADMNVALAYYNALDDLRDDGKASAKMAARRLAPHLEGIQSRWPRQCQAIAECIGRLSALEQENCPNPDEPANCFGALMGQLFVLKEDLWKEDLYGLGFWLGRFVYLTDAAVDYRRDVKKKKYNPFAAMGTGEDPQRWEEYLVLSMAKCTQCYERLPLVQDKGLMDNIVYSGVWGNYRRKLGRKDEAHD